MCLVHPTLSLCIWLHSLYASLHAGWPMHSHELHTGHSIRGTLTATGLFCDVDYSRELHIMLLLSVSHPAPLSPHFRHTQPEQQAQLIQINICGHNLSGIWTYGATRSQDKIRCRAFINNKYQWSQDEGWGDWAAKEGKRWFNVKSQQTSPLLWSKPSACKRESASAETLQIHRNPHTVKGWVVENQAGSEGGKNNAGIKWIK